MRFVVLLTLAALFAVATLAVTAPAPLPKGDKRRVADAGQLLGRLKLGKSVLIADGWELSASGVEGTKLVKPVIKIRGRDGQLESVIEADDGEVGDGSRKGTVSLGMRAGRFHNYRDGSGGTFGWRFVNALELSGKR